jgi:DNA polymerase III epsilon subunit-like protein
MRVRPLTLLALLLLLHPLTGQGEPAQQNDRRRAAIGEARALVARLRAGTRAPLKAGQLVQVRALLTGANPDLFPARLEQGPRKDSRDASFRGSHPMFQRLARAGWYRNPKLGELQALADNLRMTRALSPSTPLSQVEILAFDLEASGGSKGRFDAKKGKLFLGWDEITQFGYTIYRGGAKVQSGTIDIRPDVAIEPVVQRITKLTPEKLANAARFESVASQILTLMQGRVLVGQGSFKNDWAWLQSNFARLGVDLPGPRGLMFDTHVLSFHSFPQGTGLKNLVARYGVDKGQNHNAGYDAAAAGAVLQAMLRERGAVTLGDAFRLQAQAQELMHKPRPQAAPGAAQPSL